MRADQRERRALPVLGDDAGRVLGVAGVVACTLCCLSIPGIAAALSATGLAFLRNDRILLPGTVIFAAVVLGILLRARARHKRWPPVIAALTAIVVVLVGLRSPAERATVLVTTGDLALLVAVVWDSRLGRRCRSPA